MSIEERKNCNCGSNMDTNMSMAINSNYNDNNGMIDCDLKQQLLQQIMEYDFAINDLALYLDTHNNDEKALCLHNRYCKVAKDLKDKYQKAYGPLTIQYPCNKWRWIELPWPWERGNY